MDTIRHFFLKPWFYIAILILGTLLKFYHLDRKQFWRDEVSAVFYTSGIKDSAMLESIPVNQVKSFGYYDSLLHLGTQPYSLKSEISGILSDTHLTPAHYVFLTTWYRLTGDDDMDYRRFSVFIFILSLPFVFLLSKALFNNSLAGWITTSLYAVSPFIHYEAQEARYYMLWVFFFIVSNYLFLQAIKHNKVLWWTGYAVASALALYTSITSGAFIFGHVVYILLLKKERRVPFSISLLFIVAAYLPWMHFLYTVRGIIQNGLAWHTIFHGSFFSLDLLFFQLLGFVRSIAFLFDTNLYLCWFNRTATPGMTVLLSDLVLLAFVIYAFFYLCTKTSREIRWFVILIILPLFLLFYISDVIRNGFTSLLWRYQIVNIAGISLVITNLLKDKIAKSKWLYTGIYFGIVFLGTVSILKIAANRCWNTTPSCAANIEEAELLSDIDHPLIITDFNTFGLVNFLSVLNDSKATTADIIYCKGTIPNLKETITGKAYSEIVVLEASDTLAQQVQLQFGTSMLPYRKEVDVFHPQLWRIKL